MCNCVEVGHLRSPATMCLELPEIHGVYQMTGSPPHDSLPHKQQELAAVREPVHRQCSALISSNIHATTPKFQPDVLCILSPAKEASRPSKREGVLSCSMCLSKARQNASASLQKGCFQAPSLLERFPPTCFFQSPAPSAEARAKRNISRVQHN